MSEDLEFKKSDFDYAGQERRPKQNQIQTAIELRDRATQVALNFAGQRISSSDGSYELLIQCVQDAMNDAIGLAFGAVESSALPGNPDHRCQCSECDPRL